MDKLKDSDLREALRRKYVNTPHVPADFNENNGERRGGRGMDAHACNA